MKSIEERSRYFIFAASALHIPGFLRGRRTTGTAANKGPIVVVITIRRISGEGVEDPRLPMPTLRKLEAKKRRGGDETDRSDGDVAEPHGADHGRERERASRGGEWIGDVSGGWSAPEIQAVWCRRTHW